VAKPHSAATETAIAVEVDELLTVRTIQENMRYHTPVTVSMLENASVTCNMFGQYLQ